MFDVAAGKTAGKTKTAARGLARGGRGTASRTVGLLGAIFSYAVRHRMRPDNPVHGVTRPADGRRERRLTDDEYKTLGEALRNAEKAKVWPAAIAAARFLALTGWRSGEVLGLRWAELDLARRTAKLGDTKTGASMRPLSHAACDLLRSLTCSGDLVFVATRGSGRMLGFPKLWLRIARLGALPADVTPHTLRHSFASLAADLGYSEPTIAALVGHKGHTMTSRYVHSADAVLLAATDAIANRTAELMGDARRPAQVIPLRTAGDMNGPPDAGKYEALIEKLIDIEQRAEIDPLSASCEALCEVIEFLAADKRARERETTRSLVRLALAVFDRLQGARPRLLFDARGKKSGAPISTSATFLRAPVNAAFHTLRKAGMSREEAGKLVAKELDLNGIKQPNGKEIAARVVMRWGGELRGKSPTGSDEFFARYLHGVMLVNGGQAPQDDAPLDRETAKAAARLFVRGLRLQGF
jgi:integrase